MKIQKTEINGVFLIEPEFRFEDQRGEIFCAYEESSWLKAWTNTDPQGFMGYLRFKKDNFSVSVKNVLRGIHVSPSSWKLATCVSGRIFLVVVDCRVEFKPKRIGTREYVALANLNFGKWQAFELNDIDRTQILVPPMCGLAHLVLSRTAIFYYKWSNVYSDDQIAYNWNDPYFNIDWPIQTPILSERDRTAKWVENKEASGKNIV